MKSPRWRKHNKKKNVSILLKENTSQNKIFYENLHIKNNKMRKVEIVENTVTSCILSKETPAEYVLLLNLIIS